MWTLRSACARGDWSRDSFPWLSARECYIGFAPATVLGVSFSGELAYEIHVPNNQLYAAYLALRKAGEAHDMRLFGSRAIESMRLEKGFLHWIVEPDQFRLLTPPGAVSLYQFHTKTAKHYFCPTCGIHAYYIPRSHPDKIDVNVRCLDGVDLSSLTIQFFNGQEWEQARADLDDGR